MTEPAPRATARLSLELPAHLHDASLEDWFDARVRPLVGDPDDECADGAWSTIAEGLTDEALSAVEELMAKEGAPATAALTVFTGWSAGYLAQIVAVAALRDGVLVQVASPGALHLLRHPDGWYADARLADATAVVAEDHPWAGREDIATVADHAALELAAVAEIACACTPIVEAIAIRSRRGRAGLWAQVADGVGSVPALLQDPESQTTVAAAVNATERLLRTAGAPWKHVPRFWMATSGEDPVLVMHRGSCCLYYRFAPREGEESADEALDAYQLAYQERFGDDDGPHYCGTCLFRKPEDVEARVVFGAEQLRVEGE